MDFRFDEDQVSLIDGVRDFLSGVHGPDMLRARDAGSAEAEGVEPRLVEMGLYGFLAPEAQGGIGRRIAEGAAIALECGRVALAGPLVDTALVAVPLLRRAGGQDGLLEAIAAGQARIALRHPANPWVADAAEATHLISTDGDGLILAEAVPVEAIESIDPMRRLARVDAPPGTPLGGTAGDLLDLAALMMAAQALGCAEAMLALASDYAGTRHQFGQPIGAFQAVKHQLANVAVALEFARPVLWRAAEAVEAGSPSTPVHVSHAAIAARQAAILSAETAIQVHGAMGYTYEVDLHFWMKRAWALAGAWGDHAFHQARVEQAIVGESLPIGPSQTFA